MPELRQNFFTKEWVVIATERAKRPEQMVVKRPDKTVPSFVATCPFCPGNESMTPKEILVLRSGEGKKPNETWTVRTVANRYPALRIEVLVQLRGRRILRVRGHHHGAANDIGRAEIATHGIQSDFHRSRMLRRSGRESKTKNVTRRPTAPGGPCNSRRMDRRCAIEPCSRIEGICSRPVHASDATPCASAAASSKFYAWELP